MVRCFINGLDSNFDCVRTLLQNGALHWFTLSLNDIIQEATEIKLNRQSSSNWTTNNCAANLMGKQGAKRHNSSNTQSNNIVTMVPDISSFCYKPADLTIKEVQFLMRQYSCPLCQYNGHPLHECSSLACVYNITLKSPSTTSQLSRPSFQTNQTYNRNSPANQPTNK